MKTFVFFLIAGFFSISQGFTHENQEIDYVAKTYLHPDQISLSSNGIHVNLNNQWFAAEAIQVDARGIYIDNSKYWTWICPKCKHENKWYANECANCGYR